MLFCCSSVLEHDDAEATPQRDLNQNLHECKPNLFLFNRTEGHLWAHFKKEDEAEPYKEQVEEQLG